MIIKKIFLVILLVFINLEAEDIVDKFRLYGLNSIEENLEQELQSTIYWTKYLKDYDVKYGFYQTKSDILLCDKSKKEFYLYKYTNKKFKLDSKISALVGEVLGDKRKEGDLKTPIGNYDLINKNTNVDQFYGPLAFITSYPNLYDRLLGKTGHGIWIHGVPLNNEKRSIHTKGCIALDNKYLEELSSKIKYSNALLIINEKGLQETSKDEIATILSNMYQWRYVWKNSDVDAYLEFYHEDFKRFDGKNLKQFSRYKRSVFTNKSKKSIIFDNINISPYPTIDGIKKYRVTFFEKYRSKNVTFTGNKDLYITLVNKKMKILIEK